MKKTITLKKTFLIILFCLLYQTIKAQNEFITSWQSTDEYPTIEIPTYDGEIYNYNVDWGDGSVSNDVVGDINHNYAEIGNYTVTITGVFPAIHFFKIYPLDLVQTPYNGNQLLSIEQWGNNQWTTMDGAFKGQESLVINANDIPDLSLCVTMNEMFYGCDNLGNGTHNSWNLWNTSTINIMSSLFNGTSFNKLISNWDVSNVTNMFSMFRSSSFNKDISNWDVSSVTNMSYMFNAAESFNQPINNWDISTVTIIHDLFSFAKSFNQPLNNWNISNLTNISFLFNGATSFNQDISNWDISSITNMRSMFRDAQSFNQDISSWDVSNVTDMVFMFGSANSFNQDISNWNVGNVTNMAYMFRNANSFNQSLNNWNVSNVTSMSDMFNSALSFNQPLNNWDVSNVETMINMFYNARIFDQDLSNWNVGSVTNCSGIFKLIKLSSQNYDALLIGWDAQNLNQNVAFNGGDSKYSSDEAETARQNMIDRDNWTIIDGGKEEPLSIDTANTSTINIYKSDKSTLQINGIVDGTLNIYSISGQSIIKNQIINDKNPSVRIPKIANGIYLVKINYKGREVVKKMIF